MTIGSSVSRILSQEGHGVGV